MAYQKIPLGRRVYTVILDQWNDKSHNHSKSNVKKVNQVRFFAIGAIVIAFTIILRLWDLSSAPIWMDEAYTFVSTSYLPAKAFLFEQIDIHPPLFFILQMVWEAFSPDLDTLRVPAAFYGVVGVGIIMLAGRDLSDPRAGIYAGLLLTVSTAHIWHSQDARMYTLLFCGAALALWGLSGLLIRQGQNIKYLLLYIVGGVIAIYSQTIALVFIASANLGALVSFVDPATRSRIAPWFYANLLLAVLSAPWLIQIPYLSQAYGGSGVTDIGVAPWFIRNVFGFPGLPRIVRLFADGAMLLTLLGSCAVLATKAQRPLTLILTFSAFCYILFVTVIGIKSGLIANRMYLIGLVPVVLILGCGLSRVGRLGAASITVLVILASVSTIIEHGRREKYDAPARALAFASRIGFPPGPIIVCQPYAAQSALLVAGDRPIYWLRPDGLLLFDAAATDGFRMGVVRYLPGLGADIERYLGRRLLKRTIPIDWQHVLAITQPCWEQYPATLDQFLRRQGFTKVAYGRPGPGLGQPVMQATLTEVGLYSRTQ